MPGRKSSKKKRRSKRIDIGQFSALMTDMLEKDSEDEDWQSTSQVNSGDTIN